MRSSLPPLGSPLPRLLLATTILVVGCNSQPAPVVPETSRYEVADDTNSGNLANTTQSPARSASTGSEPFDSATAGSAVAPRPVESRTASPGPSPSQIASGQTRSNQSLAGQPRSTQQSTTTNRPSAGRRVSDGTPPPKPSSAPPRGQNGSRPKSNRPEDLLAFINTLAGQEPSGLTQQEMEADFRKNREKILEVADQLLGGNHPEAIRYEAAQAKLTALAGLQQIDVPNAQQRRDEFCLELMNDSSTQMALLGRKAAFAFSVNEFVQGDKDVKIVLDDFKQLVALEEKGSGLLDFASQVASLFEQHGRVREAIELLELVVAEYDGIQDPKLLTEVAQLREQAALIKTDLRRKFQSVVQRQPGSVEEFLAASKTLLADGQVGSSTLRILLEQAGPALESLHRPSGAELYSLVEQAFQDHPDKETVALVKSAAEKFRRRSALMNQPFEVFGLDLEDGQRFDWSPYRGKVVLVDFWATWCDLCLQEMPNIRQNYELYREQGFEVISVNLDSDPQNVERFFSVQRLPWPTVVSMNPRQRGMNSPLATKCGINYIPFVIIIGRDGKVAGLNVSGPDLGPKLAELLRAQ